MSGTWKKSRDLKNSLFYAWVEALCWMVLQREPCDANGHFCSCNGHWTSLFFNQPHNGVIFSILTLFNSFPNAEDTDGGNQVHESAPAAVVSTAIAVVIVKASNRKPTRSQQRDKQKQAWQL